MAQNSSSSSDSIQALRIYSDQWGTAKPALIFFGSYSIADLAPEDGTASNKHPSSLCGPVGCTWRAILHQESCQGSPVPTLLCEEPCSSGSRRARSPSLVPQVAQENLVTEVHLAPGERPVQLDLRVPEECLVLLVAPDLLAFLHLANLAHMVCLEQWGQEDQRDHRELQEHPAHQVLLDMENPEQLGPWVQLVLRVQEDSRENQVHLEPKVTQVQWDLQESGDRKVIRVHKVLRASQVTQEQQAQLVPEDLLEQQVPKVIQVTQVHQVLQEQLDLQEPRVSQADPETKDHQEQMEHQAPGGQSVPQVHQAHLV
ncbi:hypothetical protein AGOR_G00110570 [Albula goreensis]|uniref:Uncharacterized protein n=1 Tax=Albula goreensis TaxID=1534307 RepID=A0A8T3DKA5_9TELE|nr:hypothetical protein AGOR_G00110570 [Albula goreensis]